MGHRSVLKTTYSTIITEKRTHIDRNFFDHKDLKKSSLTVMSTPHEYYLI